MEQKPQTTFVVPKETAQVVVTWAGVDGKIHQSEPVEIERGKTYTITVGAAHGGAGAGLLKEGE